MACAGLLLVSVLAAVSANLPDTVRSNTEPPPAARIPRPAPFGPINLSVPGAIHAPAISFSGAGMGPGAPDSNRWDASASRTSINLGPLHTEFGGTTGRRMHLATVKLEGVSVFGGSIGGSIDSRSVRVTFSWPTSP
jgi:hypothetical protein